MGNYLDSCEQILKAIGGKENIASVSHCATRLRIILKDKNKYDSKAIEKIDNVKGLFFNTGQLQIIFGLNVPEVYKDFVIVSKINGQTVESITKNVAKKGNIILSALKTIPGIVMPMLPVMIGCGLLSALLSIITIILSEGFNINITSNNWYQLFNGMSISLLTNFFVLYVCISAAKFWKVNVFIATAIGLFLIAGPELGTLIPGWASYEKSQLGSLPYSVSIFTGIISIKFCSIIERWLNNKVSDNWKMFCVAGPCIILTILFSILLFGPIMAYIEQGLGIISKVLSDKHLYGFGLAILGFLCAPIVITGIHQVFIPIFLYNITHNPYADFLTAFMIASNLSQGMAGIAVAARSKNKKIKSLGYSAGVLGIIGITEPVMFGVNLRNKKAFFGAMCGSFIGAWFMGLMQVKTLSVGGSPGILSPLFGIPNYNIPAHAQFSYMNAVWMSVGIILTLLVTFLIVFFSCGEKQNKKQTAFDKKIMQLKLQINNQYKKFTDSKFVNAYRNLKRNTYFLFNKKAKVEYQYPTFEKLGIIASPCSGKYIKLSEVKDPTFASGSVGPGFAIEPTEGIIKSPFNGQVLTIFNTKHAIGLKSNDNIELLIHIGIDTVKLDGKYFKALVVNNQHVKINEPLIKFNLKKIKKLNYLTTVMVNITNKDEIKGFKITSNINNNIDFGNEIITLDK